MIAAGLFPAEGQRSDHADSPRVGDGFMRIDAAGRVSYASPNAVSLYRRLGLGTDLTGLVLADVTRDLVPARSRPDEATLSAVLSGRVPGDTEVGASGPENVALIVRSIPLRTPEEHVGALVLMRDVTDLRRRDRELVTKDATIREIHHRVKNNLQTVAALLRLQARRIDSDSARLALEEAVRRVGSIAIVHETLSTSDAETVEFDDVADRLCRMVTEVSATGQQIRVSRTGAFGVLPSEAATALAMVLTEVVQNAVEHAYDEGATGQISISADRAGGRLRVTVADDGRGVPEDFDAATGTSLGLSIVLTLVESELGGRLDVRRAGAAGGTLVELDLPLPA